MLPSHQILTDCWWQIPSFGKDFHCNFSQKTPVLAIIPAFRKSGTALVSVFGKFRALILECGVIE
jgi:hypothetical protein